MVYGFGNYYGLENSLGAMVKRCVERGEVRCECIRRLFELVLFLS